MDTDVAQTRRSEAAAGTDPGDPPAAGAPAPAGEPVTSSPRLLALRRLLDDGRYHSGEELARRLGLSRTAIWKLLERARSYGYTIDASPRRGYRLVAVPEAPLPWEIALELGEPDTASRPIYFYPAVDSTNDAARRLAETGGAPPGTLVVADRQTRGRGRRGRSWESPPGGVYLSVVERPRCHPRHAPLVALGAALAVAQAVEELCGVSACVKWPNDLLVEGRKLCGVLAEIVADQESVRWAVIGIGVNVAPVPSFSTAEPASQAPQLAPISLAELGCRPGRAALIARIVHHLESCLAQLDRDAAEASRRVAEAVEARLAWKGREVRVETPAGAMEGVLVGVDPMGGLLVRDGAGRLQTLFAGDVSLRPHSVMP